MTDIQHIADVVTLSRNETENLCMKAARGAGFSWGMAEEVGFATGWLAAQGIDGATPLLEMLNSKPGRSSLTGQPRPTPGHWQSLDDSPLCPIKLGTALIDRALLSDGPLSQETQFDPVEAPLLLLPFLARAAQISQRSFAVEWLSDSLHISRDGAFNAPAAVALARSKVQTIRISRSSGAAARNVPAEPAQLPSIPVSTLDGIAALALRTTVPASSASRSGAGSSTPDND